MSKLNDTNKNRKESSWEYAYSQIKSRILSMEIKPGELLSENNISKELGVSRTPVREAFKELEKDGLVITSNKRKRVFTLTPKEIRDVFDLKISIEGSVAKWAAERRTAEQAKELGAVISAMRQFVAEKGTEKGFHENLNEWLNLDNDFHGLLFKMGGNRRAEEIIKNLNYQWHRFHIGILGIEWRIPVSMEEHAKVADSVIAGAGDEAAAVMREHLLKLKDMIIHLMETFHI